MENTMMFKKQLSKTVTSIRNEIGGGYPKAMMTAQQIEHRTATINCGGEWRPAERTKEIAESVSRNPGFITLIEKHGVVAELEYNRAMDAWQIRMTW